MLIVGAIKTFEDLECWKAGNEVRRFFTTVTNKFPKNEYSFIDNVKRAARSVTNNMAEGYGRFHFQENIQYCRHSRGSLYELLDDLIIAKDDQYITEDEFKKGKELIEKTLAILNGYINYLVKAKDSTKKVAE